ncbi:MAG TPA: hypothetical protein GX702_13580 [Chloroflexi bacterium]|nr:hypothetical protein [Chloroflexota bacterium]
MLRGHRANIWCRINLFEVDELGQELNEIYQARVLIGIAQALRDEIHDGFLGSLTSLIHGEIFDDYLEMAEYLIDEGYKDAAAVIAGSTLEAHLRRLCPLWGVDTRYAAADGTQQSKKASRLNDELAKAGAYTRYDHKHITAWLDLRNNAAHGEYSAYTSMQVEQFIDGLREFMDRNPA